METTTQEKTLHIEGMHCDGCANAVNSRLQELGGVTESDVNLDDDSARVRYRPGMVTMEDFARAVEKAGYTLAGEGKENQ